MMPRYSDPADAPWELLARHLAQAATAGERADLRAWVEADPSHLQILTTATRAWERAGEVAASPVLFSPADVEAAWQRFRPLLATALEPAEVTATSQPVVRRLEPLRGRDYRWPLAAGLGLLLGAGYVLARGWLSGPPEIIITYASAANRQLVHLPDGSTVWLNARSRLRYAGAGPAHARGLRAVQLTGEAYFEVEPNTARPFVVTTSTARVRVTGTAFNVRAYAAEDSVEVSVTRGRVWLTYLSAPDSVQLPAGTRAALHATDAPGRTAARLRRQASADPNFQAWQTDTLRFADTPVAQVVQTLRATFGTSVQLSSPALGQCRFTGTFVRQSPTQVLAVLAAATASRLTPTGRGGFSLQGSGCVVPTAGSSTPTAAAGLLPGHE